MCGVNHRATAWRALLRSELSQRPLEGKLLPVLPNDWRRLCTAGTRDPQGHSSNRDSRGPRLFPAADRSYGMNPQSPSHERRARIEAMFHRVEMLLSEAQHETVKEQVLLARRDLDEGLRWLQQPNVDGRPRALKIVDLLLSLAQSRLQMVADGLSKFGPDVMLVQLG